MRTWAILAACALLLCTSGFAQAGDLTFEIKDGKVTLVAQNVPVRQILAEWSRVGQTKVVGADRLTGPPVTLQLTGVPERQALETLLRSVSGYMAAPRPMPTANASVYDRILILATSTAPAATGPASPTSRPAPNLAPAPVAPTNDDSDIPDDITEAQRRGEEPNDADLAAVGGRPAEATFDYANPQLMMQQRQQLQQQQKTGAGAITPGSAQPGMIVQPPQQPNVFPGTTTPSAAPVNPTSARPGEMVQPPPQVNPYGLPAGVQPGSVQAPNVQPDRSKYMNPYQPNQQQEAR